MRKGRQEIGRSACSRGRHFSLPLDPAFPVRSNFGGGANIEPAISEEAEVDDRPEIRRLPSPGHASRFFWRATWPGTSLEAGYLRTSR